MISLPFVCAGCSAQTRGCHYTCEGPTLYNSEFNEERQSLLFWDKSIQLLILTIYFLLFLMGWSLLPNALRPFKIYCAPSSSGITRRWVCRLNFAQRPIFSGLRFFKESEIWDSGFPAYRPSRRVRIFTSWKKSINLSRIWTREPWISTRARYPETTEADYAFIYFARRDGGGASLYHIVISSSQKVTLMDREWIGLRTGQNVDLSYKIYWWRIT